MFKKIAQLPDVGTAVMVQSLLEAEGLRVLELQVSGHVSLAGTNTSFFIEVAEEDSERAAAVLAANDLGKWILN